MQVLGLLSKDYVFLLEFIRRQVRLYEFDYFRLNTHNIDTQAYYDYQSRAI